MLSRALASPGSPDIARQALISVRSESSRGGKRLLAPGMKSRVGANAQFREVTLLRGASGSCGGSPSRHITKEITKAREKSRAFVFMATLYFFVGPRSHDGRLFTKSEYSVYRPRNAFGALYSWHSTHVFLACSSVIFQTWGL